MKRLIALLLCLLLPVAAMAGGMSLKYTITSSRGAMSGTVAAGITPVGTALLQLPELSLMADDAHGILLHRNNEDWQRLTCFGLPVSLKGLSVPEEHSMRLQDPAAGFEKDLPLLTERLDGLTDSFMKNDAVKALMSRWKELLTAGSMTITASQLNDVILAFLNCYGGPFGLTAAAEKDSVVLGKAAPAFFTDMELQSVYEQLVTLLTGMTDGMQLPLLPDFTLTLAGELSSGVLTLTSEQVFLNASFTADAAVMGYRYSMMGQLWGHTVSATGSIGINSLVMEADVGSLNIAARVVMGDHATLSLSVTDTRKLTNLLTLSAVFVGNGISLTLSTPEISGSAALSLNRGSTTLNAMFQKANAGLLAPTLLRLDVSVLPSGVTAGCVTQGRSTYLHLNWSGSGASLQLTDYDMHTGNTLSLTAEAAMTAQLVSLNGSLTLPGGNPLVFGLNIHTAGQYGAVLNLSMNGVMHNATAMLTFPAVNTTQLVLQHKISGSVPTRSLSAIATHVTWKGGSQLDVTADDTADELPAFTASLSRTEMKGGVQWRLHHADLTASLTLEPAEQSTALRFSLTRGSVPLLAGSADVTAGENSFTLSGRMGGLHFDEMSLEAELLTNAELAEPVLPEVLQDLELCDLLTLNPEALAFPLLETAADALFPFP